MGVGGCVGAGVSTTGGAGAGTGAEVVTGLGAGGALGGAVGVGEGVALGVGLGEGVEEGGRVAVGEGVGVRSVLNWTDRPLRSSTANSGLPSTRATAHTA